MKGLSLLLSNIHESPAEVWKVEHPEILESELNRIPLSEVESFWLSKIQNDAKRTKKKQRRQILKFLLAQHLGCAPAEVLIDIGPLGKPCLPAKFPRLFFNNTTSEELSLIALSPSEIGVDIERHKPNLHIDLMIKHYFSEDESRYIDSKPGRIQNFLTIWTIKEACLKASAVGLSGIRALEVLPEQINLNVGNRLRVYHDICNKDYIFAAAIRV